MCASLIAKLVKNLPAVQGTWVRFLGWGDLAWRIPGTEEPDGLQPLGSQKSDTT